jgi:ABC-2 type transport system permease protein
MRYLGALLLTNLKASIALRGAFWARAVFMALNNGIVLTLWLLFFLRYGDVKGWHAKDTVALYAVCASAFGLAVILGHGVNDLARRIHEGGLDAFLTQPKDVLLQCVASRSEASGWGDLGSSVVLFAVAGYLAPATLPICLVTALSGAAIFLATAVLFHSIAFWLGDTTTVSRQAWHFVILFSLYPSTIFGGWLKLMLFTALPAGFIAYLPVDLLHRFSWTTLLGIAGAAVAYVAVAAFVFRLGLRRYQSARASATPPHARSRPAARGATGSLRSSPSRSRARAGTSAGTRASRSGGWA